MKLFLLRQFEVSSSRSRDAHPHDSEEMDCDDCYHAGPDRVHPDPRRGLCCRGNDRNNCQNKRDDDRIEDVPEQLVDKFGQIPFALYTRVTHHIQPQLEHENHQSEEEPREHCKPCDEVAQHC